MRVRWQRRGSLPYFGMPGAWLSFPALDLACFTDFHQARTSGGATCSRGTRKPAPRFTAYPSRVARYRESPCWNSGSFSCVCGFVGVEPSGAGFEEAFDKGTSGSSEWRRQVLEFHGPLAVHGHEQPPVGAEFRLLVRLPGDAGVAAPGLHGVAGPSQVPQGDHALDVPDQHEPPVGRDIEGRDVLREKRRGEAGLEQRFPRVLHVPDRQTSAPRSTAPGGRPAPRGSPGRASRHGP